MANSNQPASCQLPERVRTVVDSGQSLLRKLLAGKPEPNTENLRKYANPIEKRKVGSGRLKVGLNTHGIGKPILPHANPTKSHQVNTKEGGFKMTQQGTTTEVSLEEQAERLWNLANATHLDYRYLTRFAEKCNAYSLFMPQAKHHIASSMKTAEEAITRIEDAIKRYREGKLQSYEEKPTD